MESKGDLGIIYIRIFSGGGVVRSNRDSGAMQEKDK